MEFEVNLACRPSVVYRSSDYIYFYLPWPWRWAARLPRSVCSLQASYGRIRVLPPRHDDSRVHPHAFSALMSSHAPGLPRKHGISGVLPMLRGDTWRLSARTAQRTFGTDPSTLIDWPTDQPTQALENACRLPASRSPMEAPLTAMTPVSCGRRAP